MNAQLQQFDPLKYKETTREQGSSAAEAWDRWGGLLSEWLGPATEVMLDMAGVGPGSRVLDVAAGAGEQTISAARRVGESGEVLATDISPTILEYAQRAARNAGLNNVRTQVVDGEELETLEEEPFDAVISRVGLIYFPDQHKALTGMKKKLKEGGRLAAMVYSTAERNPFFSIPVSVIRERAHLPPPLPGQPGPFSLGEVDKLADTLEQAGFREIEVEVIQAPVCLPSAKDCLRFEKESFGALHQMLAGLSDEEKEEAWQVVEERLEQFEQDGCFTGPCEMLVAVGTR